MIPTAPVSSVPRPPARRRAAALAVLLVASAVWFALGPASADPSFTGGPGLSVFPNSGPVAGGTPVRIYGNDLGAVSFVSFGGIRAPSLKVVDDHLLIAVTPPSPSSGPGYADVRIGTEGATASQGFYYSDAQLKVTPDAGVKPGDKVTVTLTGYAASQPIEVAVVSPLLGYVEPRFASYAGRPEVQIVDRRPTDASGGLTVTEQIPPASGSGSPCPPTQEQADAGLPTCYLAVSQSGPAMLTVPLTYQDNPQPAGPTLETQVSSPDTTPVAGSTVTVKGVNWVGSPTFGSATREPRGPGVTLLSIEVCGIGGDAGDCTTADTKDNPSATASTSSGSSSSSSTTGTLPTFPTTASGTVAPTKAPDGKLSGAVLDGSITLGSSFRSGCSTCVVRVRQGVFGGSDGQVLEQSAPLDVAPGDGHLPVPTTTATTSTTTTTVCSAATSTTAVSASFSTSSSSASSTEPSSSTSSTTACVPATSTTLPPTKETNFNYTPFSGTVGTVVTFWGPGLRGVTSITFGGVAGVKFARLATDRVSVLVPGGITGQLDIVLLGGPYGPLTAPGGFYIVPPDLRIEVSPNINLSPGQEVAVTTHRYPANTGMVIAEASPLVIYNQTLNGAEFPPGPPPDGAPIAFPFTDNNGDLNVKVKVGNSSPPDPTKGQPTFGDPQASCPVTQEQANVGLRYCWVEVTPFGQIIVDPGSAPSQVKTDIHFVGEPAPQSPTLTGTSAKAAPGQTVSLTGERWSGQPLRGSTRDDPTTVELCGVPGSQGCRRLEDAAVAPTTYTYDPANPSQGVLSGGRLRATITVPDDIADSCDCTLRVTQPVTSFFDGSPTGDPPLVATIPLRVELRTKPDDGKKEPTGSNDDTNTPPSATSPVNPAPSSDTPFFVSPSPLGGNVAGGVPPVQPVQPVPPGGGGGVAPAPAPSPSAAAAPAPGNPVTQPAAGAQQETDREAAPQRGHLMVRRDDSEQIAVTVGLSSAALAAAGAGCVIAYATTAAPGRRRRRYDAERRPRPRGAY